MRIGKFLMSRCLISYAVASFKKTYLKSFYKKSPKNKNHNLSGGIIELNLPKIVLGRTIKTLLYAYKNELPVIIHKPIKPSDVEFISDIHDFDFLHFEYKPTYGQVWDRLSFALGMGGYMIAPDLISSFRHDTETKVITIVSKQSSRFTVKYQEVIQPDVGETGNVYLYDWFDVKVGSKNFPDVMRGDEEAPQKLVFYESRRQNVRDGLRDFVAISRVKETKMNSWDYSEVAIEYACYKLFKKHNIKGGANGYTRHGKQRYYPVKIQHAWREIKSEIKSIHTLEELCKMKQKGNHLTNLTTNLFLTTKTFTSQE